MKSQHIPATQAVELCSVKQHFIYLWVLGEDVVDESLVARPQGTAAAAHACKRRDRAGEQGHNPQPLGNPLREGAFGGKRILGFSGEAWEEDMAPSW